jgi:hypothetical protein
MALIYCPECGTQVSDQAPACIKCAYPIAQKINNINGVNHLNELKQKQQTSTVNQTNVNNSIVWVLAFAPIIGTFLQGFIVGLLFGDNWFYYFNKFWWITLALNLILCYWDEKKLEKQGVDTESMGSSFLVPIYLYKRASVLSQSPIYLWVWISTYLITFIF